MSKERFGPLMHLSGIFCFLLVNGFQLREAFQWQEKCKIIAVGFAEFTPANRSRTVSEVARSVLQQEYQKQICIRQDGKYKIVLACNCYRKEQWKLARGLEHFSFSLIIYSIKRGFWRKEWWNDNKSYDSEEIRSFHSLILLYNLLSAGEWWNKIIDTTAVESVIWSKEPLN